MAASKKEDGSLVVSESLLQDLARKLKAEWLELGRMLGMSDPDLHNIETDKRGNTKEAKYQMFICWKEANGNEATHNVLADALSKAGRTDLADEVLGELADKVKLEEDKAKKQPEHMTADMEKKKTLFVAELMNKYIVLCGGMQPVPFLRNTSYNIDKLFVPNGIKFLEAKHGEGKKNETWTMLKDYKTVFTNPKIKSKIKRRIIDGEPGYGKSTLLLQMTNDWCQGKAPMNEFDVLILLLLRQFRDATTVYSAIKGFLLPQDSKLTEGDIKIILDSSSTVVLFDSYDEYPDQKKKDNVIECIIKGDKFQEHEVVLTTRTSCLPPSISNDAIKRLRLTGFDDTSRKTYIREVVAAGCSDDADNISKFLKENPISADLCKSPLLFTMISYMVKNNEELQILKTFKTVRHFFSHIIKCFHSHWKNKIQGDGNGKEGLDHSKLDEIAFEGLSGDAQQISWATDKLKGKIGDSLYDEYIRIGILKKEEGFNYDTLEYNEETRFVHKLFAEWYAAYYLAELAARPEATFTQRHLAANTDKVHLLKNLDPDDVHYMYRYACGLNHEAALKIIKHLAKNEFYNKYTLLCMAEWSGSLETIMDIVTLLCKRTIRFEDTDSLLLQKSIVALVNFASTRKIPMDSVELDNCLDVGYNGILSVKPSNLHLPVIDTTLSRLRIYEPGLEITEEETDSILQYSAKCLGLKLLWFRYCLFPVYIKVTESMSVLRQRDIKVGWTSGSGRYNLNLESGQWEDLDRSHTPMTGKQYQEAVEFVRRRAEEITRKRLKEL